jgi:hypothetical protein
MEITKQTRDAVNQVYIDTFGFIDTFGDEEK